MHVFFSGIGGTGIGPLALIAHQAGLEVSGSDKQDSNYIHYLADHGVANVHLGQSYEQLAVVHAKQPINWFVYTSALSIENPDAPELRFCRDNGIKATKRDELLSHILTDKQLKLIAVAGTHGKSTTTAMAIWLFKELGLPVSYSVGAKLTFGDMGTFDPKSEYFLYEADEFDRNFLSFHPFLALISGIDWDHPDIYPTRDSYNAAFEQFIEQSEHVALWADDLKTLGIDESEKVRTLDGQAAGAAVQLAGEVNRKNALLVACGLQPYLHKPLTELTDILGRFPGLGRRFEAIQPNLYTDYAHTPPKIQGALQLAHEVAGDNVVVVYEGLHNTRQHFIKKELATLFDGVKQLYIVPTYLAREDPSLALLSPTEIKALLSKTSQDHTEPAELNDSLKQRIQARLDAGDTVLCITAGGGGSLDEWLRKTFV